MTKRERIVSVVLAAGFAALALFHLTSPATAQQYATVEVSADRIADALDRMVAWQAPHVAGARVILADGSCWQSPSTCWTRGPYGWPVPAQACLVDVDGIPVPDAWEPCR